MTATFPAKLTIEIEVPAEATEIAPENLIIIGDLLRINCIEWNDEKAVYSCKITDIEKIHDCPICFERLVTDIYTTNCQHKFHKSCLTKIKSGDCPICRKELVIKTQKDILVRCRPFRHVPIYNLDDFSVNFSSTVNPNDDDDMPELIDNDDDIPPLIDDNDDDDLPPLEYNGPTDRDVELVMDQTNCSRPAAQASLIRYEGDIVDAIMHLNDHDDMPELIDDDLPPPLLDDSDDDLLPLSVIPYIGPTDLEVELVMSQTNCSRSVACARLTFYEGDIVRAIMDLNGAAEFERLSEHERDNRVDEALEADREQTAQLFGLPIDAINRGARLFQMLNQ